MRAVLMLIGSLRSDIMAACHLQVCEANGKKSAVAFCVTLTMVAAACGRIGRETSFFPFFPFFLWDQFLFFIYQFPHARTLATLAVDSPFPPPLPPPF